MGEHLQRGSCRSKPPGRAGKMGEVFSLSTITLKDLVTVFLCVCLCVKEIGRPRSSEHADGVCQ